MAALGCPDIVDRLHGRARLAETIGERDLLLAAAAEIVAVRATNQRMLDELAALMAEVGA